MRQAVYDGFIVDVAVVGSVCCVISFQLYDIMLDGCSCLHVRGLTWDARMGLLCFASALPHARLPRVQRAL